MLLRGPSLERLPDWPERLAAYIEQQRHEPFTYGVNDCATFAAGALAAMTGGTAAEWAAWMPGRWDNEAQALDVLRRVGGLRGGCRYCLGRPVLGPRAAMVGRGAVVCVRLPHATLGVAAGNGYWCAPGAMGLVWRPMSEVRRAWEI